MILEKAFKWLVWRSDETMNINVCRYRETSQGMEISIPGEITEDGAIVYRQVEIFENEPIIPTFVLPKIMASSAGMQDLIDGLCDVTGLRPSAVPIDEGALVAQTKHLADLQRIVFDSQYVQIERGKEDADI